MCSAFTDRNMTTDPKSGARGRPRGITGARSAAETKHRPRSVALLVWEGVGRSACPPSPRGPAKKERKLAFGGPRRADSARLCLPAAAQSRGRRTVGSAELTAQREGVCQQQVPPSSGRRVFSSRHHSRDETYPRLEILLSVDRRMCH